jgi:DNA polymerase-3 subunit chi
MSPPRVSFYVLTGAEPGARLGYACRLVEKVYRLQQRVHAHAADDGMARHLDELLWTFRQGSFVPHELLSPSGTTPVAPVTIGSTASAAGPPAADLLVNLADDVPDFYGGFARIAEIVDGSAAGREAGRARHRFYRQQGLEPETHEVT